MKILDVPFTILNWDEIPPVEYPGEKGFALWRTGEIGNLRVRIVEYSPGYIADHWCSKGHVVLVLEGELITDLQDGKSFVLTPGMSYQVSDIVAPHRSRTIKGVKLFIVD
jgi:hypothetical protein